MPVPTDWFEHRRGDGELLGWITPVGDDFSAIDLLGRQSAPTEWMDAERHLEDLGIGYLADIYLCRIGPDDWRRVRILEVSTQGLTVGEDDYGDITANLPKYRLPFPPGDRLLPADGHRPR